MRNYLKYLSDTLYSFQRKYDLTDNQMRFLLFISDEKGSFTKRFIRENMYVSKNFNDRMFPELVKRDYIFVFEKNDLIICLAKREHLKDVESIFSISSI